MEHDEGGARMAFGGLAASDLVRGGGLVLRAGCGARPPSRPCRCSPSMHHAPALIP